MSLFARVSTDAYINDRLKAIDKFQIDNLPSDHGTRHSNAVANKMGKFLTECGCDDKTIDLGRVAGLLHDLGAIHGKENHAQTGADIAREYLLNIGVDNFDTDIIANAIANHSSGKVMDHIVTAGLVLCDKCDWTRDRFHEKSTTEGDWVLQVIEHITDTTVTVTSDKLVITYTVGDKFLKEGLERIFEIKPVFPKVAKFLDKDLVIEIK